MKTLALHGALMASALLAGGSISAQEIADIIYSGGSILTIEDDQPTAEAVAIKDGRILAVGEM